MGFLSGVSSFIEKHSEAVHAVLDVAGFIPVVGAVADIANTALYIHEGDAGNAIMCGIAAIPGIGDLASLARKSYNAFKTSKTGIKVMNALKKYKGVEKILSSLRGKMKTGARGLSKLSEGFGKLFDRIKNLLKGGCMDGRCFTGDTLVLTKHGYTAIKEIQKGDEILSRDEKTGRTGFKEVEDVFIRTVHTIYHVWLDGKEEIKTTAYHPVYVQEQGWVTAINLREGDTLETMEGTACITKIVKERHEEPVTVYNLAVKDWVSYFVGQVRVYVHNRKKYNPNNLILNHGTPNNPKTVRRFMSKQEYKEFKKNGFIFDPNDPRRGISATSITTKPINPDMIKQKTGALGADYYVDIDVSNKNKFFKGRTKGGLTDWKIQDNVNPSDIIGSGRVKK